MRTVPAVAIWSLLLMQGGAQARPARFIPAPPPAWNVVLTGRAAKRVFNQCSRAAPTQVSGYWTPLASDIKPLETEAPAFFSSQKDKPDLPWNKYARQYAGYVQGGRRMIYVNCAPLEGVEQDDRDMKAARGKGLDWRHTAFVVCDGGPQFFGMEYDVAAHQFRNLSFNGPG